MDCRNAPVASSHHDQRYPRGTAARGATANGAAPRLQRSSLILGALPTAVPCARLHARQVRWEWGLAPVADTAELLVSELATNGLKAAWATGWGSPISLGLSASQELLVIEVWDGNPRPPVVPELDDDVPALDEESGRGLFLVGTLSRAGAGTRPATSKER